MKIISLDKGCFAFILGLLLWCSHMHANYLNPTRCSSGWQSPVSGTVRDNTGVLPGVTIYIKGGASSTISSDDGSYTIAAALGDTLVFSFIGFKEAELVVTSQRHDMVLQEDVAQLQEVVINAGYYSVKEQERTGNISRITAKDIEKQPVSNVLATMQGRMAGVDIIQEGGTPGGGFQIRIRGQNSLRSEGNDPLYIIDGVPYSSESIGSPNTSTATPTSTSPLNNINPADIESIEVLKDADATAIYGSRGANGVVLITTKKGKAGKTSVSVSASSGFGEVTKKVRLMDTAQYLEMRRQGFANDGITAYPSSAYDVNGTWDPNRSTDWQEELIGGTAEIYTMHGSVSGGSEATQYLLSGNYRKETTVLPGDFEYKKGNVHFTMNHLSQDEKFRLSFSSSYTSQNNLQAATDLTRTARYLAPNAPALYDSEGNLNWENGTFENPLAALRSTVTARTNDLTSNAVLTYKIIPGLEVKSNFGFNSLQNDERRTVPSTIYDPAYGLGSEYSALFTTQLARKSWIIEPQIRWDHSFGSANIDVLVGATAQHQQDARLQQMGYGYSSNSLIDDLASASQKYIFLSDEIVYRYQAFFTRLNLNWDGKYIINLTGRRDGSSRFGPGNQYGNFGAVGLAWIFSKEKYLQDSRILSFGKIRSSYGTSGNDQIGDYQFLDTYASSGVSYQGIVGLNPIRLYNPAFGWETNRKFEIGLEAGFFRDRIFLSASHYRNRSSNQLIGIPLPGTTGFTSLNANLDATVQNAGWEFTLSTKNFTGESFRWSTNFNISASKNKLLSFPDLQGSTYVNKFVIGQSLNIVKLYDYQGVNPETGLYEFTDVDGDGILSDVADKQTVADLTPKFFGGIQNQLQYKNWQLDFLFQFVKQQNYDYIANVPGGQFYNQRQDMAVAWQAPGDQAAYQLNTSGANSAAVQAYNNYAQSDATIVDGSYVRLKNVALSYDLPLKKELPVRCRLYVQGQNLLTFTSYKGGDPEFRFYGFLPPLKIYTMGVQLNF